MFLIIALSLMRVIVSNNLSTAGITLLKLENRLNSYKIENTNLRERLLNFTSLSYISSESSQLTKPLPLAIKQ